MDRIRSHIRRPRKAGVSPVRKSGNRAFDEYRDATLRRLQDEQQAFAAFLDRLQKSKDQERFETFLSSNSPQHQE